MGDQITESASGKESGVRAKGSRKRGAWEAPGKLETAQLRGWASRTPRSRLGVLPGATPRLGERRLIVSPWLPSAPVLAPSPLLSFPSLPVPLPLPLGSLDLIQASGLRHPAVVRDVHNRCGGTEGVISHRDSPEQLFP